MCTKGLLCLNIYPSARLVYLRNCPQVSIVAYAGLVLEHDCRLFASQFGLWLSLKRANES